MHDRLQRSPIAVMFRGKLSGKEKTRKTGEEDVKGERRKRGLKNKSMTMREAQLRQTRTK